MNKEEIMLKVFKVLRKLSNVALVEYLVTAIVEEVYEEEEAEVLESDTPIYSEIIQLCFSQVEPGEIYVHLTCLLQSISDEE